MTHRLGFLLFIIACLNVSVIYAQDSDFTHAQVIEIDGVERTYELYLPDDLAPDSTPPLLLVLHPNSSSGRAMQALTHLDEATAQGYVVAFLDTYQYRWNDGRTEVGIDWSQEPDDIAFMRAVITDLSDRYNVDPERVDYVGHGNGGQMGYRVMCNAQALFDHVIIVGPLMFNSIPQECEVSSETAANLLVIHGSADPNYRWETTTFYTVDGSSYTILGVNDTLGYWMTLNKCDLENIQFDENILSAPDCLNDTRVDYYLVRMGLQTWLRDDYILNHIGLDTTSIILDYLAGAEDWAPVQEVFPDYQQRSWVTYVPKSYDPDTPMPVVMLLHGRYGSGAGTAMYAQMNQRAEEYGFIGVYPDGHHVAFPSQIDTFWNYTRGTPYYQLTVPADDAQYLVDLLDDLSGDLNIDMNRVYVGGLSNGGYMALRMSCEVSDRFAAFASVAGSGYQGLEEICDDSAPAPILIIHGTADGIVPWDGITQQATLQSTGETIDIHTSWAIPDLVDYFVARNGCEDDAEPVPVETASDEDGTATSVDVTLFENCQDNSAVALYTVINGGHNWPGVPSGIPDDIGGRVTTDIHASDTLIEFFFQHSLDAN